MTDRSSFNWRVIDQLDELINQSGKSRAEIITSSGMRRNTFFVKMRGETALTTDDIAKIAGALGADPFLVLKRASKAKLSVVPPSHTESLHEVDLAGELDLAATEDRSGVRPERGES